MMDRERRQAIRAREQAATRGHLDVQRFGTQNHRLVVLSEAGWVAELPHEAAAEAAFIAAARADVPDLLWGQE